MAAGLIRDFNLDTCDALIVATVSTHGAEILYTRDGLKPRKNKTSPLDCHDKIGEPPLSILPPNAAAYLSGPLYRRIT